MQNKLIYSCLLGRFPPVQMVKQVTCITKAFKINLLAQFGAEILVFLLLRRRTSSSASCQNTSTAKASLKFSFPIQVYIPSLSHSSSSQEHNLFFQGFCNQKKICH